jgi:flagellar assembly factor FliW
MARLKYKLLDSEIRELDTKFGKIQIDMSAAICFPTGVIGISGNYYCLTEIPENKLPGALLLQNLDNIDFGFLVLPLSEKFYTGENSLIKYEDVESAISSYGIEEENVNILVISSIKKTDGQLKISINLKAPIFIDSKEKIAFQHVFIKKEYPVAYPLN